MNRLTFFRALLPAAFLALALHTGPATAAEKVRLAINLAPISGLAIIADQNQLFAKHGLDVTVSHFTSGRAALEAVMGGAADFATTAEAPVTAAMFANQKLALLARMEYSELKTLAAVPAIRQPADLKGKRIGYAAGTGSEVYTHRLLKRAGLAKSDVTLVALRPQDMAAAAAAGGIDAYCIWEPHAANGRKALGEKARVLDLGSIYSETFNVVVTDDYARGNPKVAAAFLRALLEAEQWLKAHRDDAIALIAGATRMNTEELAEIWNDYVFELVLDQRTLDTLRNHAQWRIDSGNAAGGATTLPDFGRVIHPGPLKSVAAERVKI